MCWLHLAGVGARTGQLAPPSSSNWKESSAAGLHHCFLLNMCSYPPTPCALSSNKYIGYLLFHVKRPLSGETKRKLMFCERKEYFLKPVSSGWLSSGRQELQTDQWACSNLSRWLTAAQHKWAPTLKIISAYLTLGALIPYRKKIS